MTATATAALPIRYVVLGAGAIGASVGAQLDRAGYDTVLVARGAHRDAIARDGLRLLADGVDERRRIAVAGHPRELTWSGRDIVLLAVKSQDTADALAGLAEVAPPSTPVVCLQNGLRNEAAARERFTDVYGVMVYLPSAYLTPGEVVNYAAPARGVLVLGSHPGGVGALGPELAETLTAAGFTARAVPDILAWKRRKLLTNLGNAVDVLSGLGDGFLDAIDLLGREAEAVFAAAGLPVVDRDVFAAQVDGQRLAEIPGRPYPGGSTAQSVLRGGTAPEVGEFNGEIARLGRDHGVPTPANSLVAALVDEVSRGIRPARGLPLHILLPRLRKAALAA
ncbi:2-dehydropantoate 2-reductase [Frankia canadensis]|uniref:2-dehydropantoate 2-reductase n=1 Tax=Frankia canadensis TaxID=1836972 RepID=A0A2I2L1E6_9ACTN|nr:2-dehydropantoate 2-reductase N-terminal domain-containing protein [Frankia canadensis]SNQ51744.1 2-dehydropantoate 2-reductase [Frankia canadensis]SOU59034.1 2-dehydropantoate 2-reductase [Frankia canadensis]